MANIDIGDVLGSAMYRTFARNGLKLLGALFVVQLIAQVGTMSMFYSVFEDFWDDFVTDYPEIEQYVDDPETFFPLAFELAQEVAALLALLGSVLTLIGVAVALRVFTSEHEDRIPTELIFDNLAWVVLNLFIGGIIFAILWGIGLVFFVIPGIFIFVSLVLFMPIVAVEDTSFIEGMQRAWGLSRGNRLDLFLLFLGYFLVVFGVSLAFGLVSSMLYIAAPIAGQLLDVFVNTLFLVYFAAVVSLAYRRLTAPDEAEPEEDPFEEFEPAGQNAQW